MIERLRPLAGVLLLAMTLASIAHGLAPRVCPRALPAALAWAAGLLLLGRLSRMHRLQVMGMAAVGGLGLALAAWRGATPALGQALSANEAILAMLGGVTFLRLLSRPGATDEALPVGRAALLRTLIGTHLFGAIINASAVLIIGDRLSRGEPLSRLQAIVLSRAFSCASFWSPFFAGMGVALLYAPGARLAEVAALGLPLALAALGWSAVELGRLPEAARFSGYPLHLEALTLPGVLALAVLGLHELLPALSIITLVAALCLLFALVVVPLREGRRGPALLARHVTLALPAMATELALFLSAGVLGVGIAAALGAFGLELPFTTFGGREAWLLTAAMVGLAALGLHPVIGITLAAQLLEPLGPDPLRLALCFVLAWGLGVAVSPFSGLHLMIQGHYGIASHRFVRWNGRYVLGMLGLVGVFFTALDALAPPGG